MTSLKPFEATAQSRDIPNLGERIIRILLTAPARRTEMEQALLKFEAESTGPEFKRHSAEMTKLMEARTEMVAAMTARRNEAIGSAEARVQRQSSKVNENEQINLLALVEYRVTQIEKIEKNTEESQWTADAVYESLEPQPRLKYERAREKISQAVREILEQVDDAEELFRKARVALSPLSLPEAEVLSAIQDPAKCLSEQSISAIETLQALRRNPLKLIARNWAAHLAFFIVSLVLVLGIVVSIAGWELVRDLKIILGCCIGIAVIQSFVWIWAGKSLHIFAGAISLVRLRTNEASRIALAEALHRRTEQESTFRIKHQQEHADSHSSMNPKRTEIEEFCTQRRTDLREAADRLRRNSVAQYEAALLEIEQKSTGEFERVHQQFDELLRKEKTRHEDRKLEIAAVISVREQALRTPNK